MVEYVSEIRACRLAVAWKRAVGHDKAQYRDSVVVGRIAIDDDLRV